MDPCRPSPWNVADTIFKWGGKDQQDLRQLIATDEITIIHRHDANDKVARAELPKRMGLSNRKVYGYIAEICESDTTLNTRIPYRFAAAIQICYYQAVRSEDSWFWAQTSAFSSNVLLANSVGVQLGAPICGILAATYGAHLTAQLEIWYPTTWGDWSLGGMGGIPKPWYFDLDPSSYEWIPAIGCSAFDLERLRWTLPAVRLKPPHEDVRIFHREIAQKKKAGKEKAGPSDPKQDAKTDVRKEAEKIYTAISSHNPRDESVLAAVRANSRRPNENRGRNRPRRPHYLRSPWLVSQKIQRINLIPSPPPPQGPVEKQSDTGKTFQGETGAEPTRMLQRAEWPNSPPDFKGHTPKEHEASTGGVTG